MEIKEIVLELNRRYREALIEKQKEPLKRGERSKIFLTILENLYRKYGEYFGYNSFSDFKRIVVCSKNNKKNKEKNKISQPAIMDKKIYFRPTEGSGAIFTEWQIHFLDLNPDSY